MLTLRAPLDVGDAVKSAPVPRLLTAGVSPSARALVLLAHGGQCRSEARARPSGRPALRLYPFFLDLARAARRDRFGVVQVVYRFAGYNDGDPVDDLRWALDGLRARLDVPVCLVGHSMGARAALRVAGHPSVTAVAALAPWTPDGEPVDQLAGRTVMLAHGDGDRVTDPAASFRYALRAHGTAARLCRFSVRGEGHAMLRHPFLWQGLVRGFVRGSLGIAGFPEPTARALALPREQACDIPL